MDTVAGTGIALIGVNNPHIDSADIDLYKVCTTIDNNEFLAEVNNPDDTYRGVVYACAVEDAAAVFEEIPDLGPLGILG